MSLSIRTNVASLTAQHNLSQTQLQLDTSLAKLSSGYRITKAGDDAAGLGISSALQAQFRSFNQAARNASDGLSVVQTAESGFNEITNILTRMKELAVQAASDGVTDNQRATMIDGEASQLSEEIDRIANSTKYNGTALLNGTTQLDFHVGIGNDDTNDVISVTAVDLQVGGANLGLGALALDTKDNANTGIGLLDTAIAKLSELRATFGAVGNRLQSAMNSVQSMAEATAAANSRIRDVDVAEETSAMTRANILAQAGVSVLAQANQMPQVALKLLG